MSWWQKLFFSRSDARASQIDVGGSNSGSIKSTIINLSLTSPVSATDAINHARRLASDDVTLDHVPLASFCTSLPVTSNTPIELAEKLRLYAYRASDYGPVFSAAQFCVAGHTFDREDITTARKKIEAMTSPVASFTIASHPFAGLSIALMQLVRELSAKPTTKVWWVIGNKSESELALSSLSIDAADIWYAELKAATPRIQMAVIVIDDFWKVRNELKQKFLPFANRCKMITSSADGPRLVFVLGSVGAATEWTINGKFDLKLTKADKQLCYQKMASELPSVLEPDGLSLNAILSEHPEERLYKDDAPAFIDFLMKHGSPTVAAKTQWLAQIDELKEYELDIVTRASVAQLVGLHVEEKVALSLLGALVEPQFKTLEEFGQVLHLEIVKDKNWRGLGLSSARRARDILVRAKRFDVSYIEESLSLFLRSAINQMQLYGSSSAPAADFARHIFQRLSKKPLYQFPKKDDICQRLLLIHIAELRHALATQDPAKKARWAGALSAIPMSTVDIPSELEGAEIQAIDLLCALCDDGIKHIEGQQLATRPETLVGLYRAGKNMLRSSRVTPVRAKEIGESLRASVSEDNFWNAFRTEFENDKEEAAHRSNELIHARVEFEAALGPKDFKFYEQMTSLTKVDPEFKTAV